MSSTMNREYKGLPEKYWHKQNFCWYIHDIILSIFDDCMKNDKMDTKIKFKKEFHAKQFECNEDVIKWLYDNDYEDKADTILGKQIFHAILADMCNFIYESLNTIEKGKITVSLALLRKPFRDNLLYLEWLLGNSKEFINMINNQDIDKYAIEKLSKNKKIEIIKLAMNKVKNKEFFSKMDENVYYDLRYNYKAENSLQRVWNKANHLVTTGNYIKSEDFNFVFLDKELYLEFIDYYYHQIPHLLFYTYNIVVELYDKFIRKIPSTTRLYNNSLIVYKFCDVIDAVQSQNYFDRERKSLLNFPCENCRKIIEIHIHTKEFDEFKNGWSFMCPNCGSEIDICKYVFLEDYKGKDKHLKIIK